jgi:hypothetical protein
VDLEVPAPGWRYHHKISRGSFDLRADSRIGGLKRRLRARGGAPAEATEREQGEESPDHSPVIGHRNPRSLSQPLARSMAHYATACAKINRREEGESLERLLRESDVVTLHARVTDETRGFIGQEQFEQMKPGAYFVNTARGPMVDYEALTEALKTRHLRGAAIETFAIEPAPDNLELRRLDNVTLTPHIAGASVKTAKFAAEAAAEEVRRYLAGESPLNPC